MEQKFTPNYQLLTQITKLFNITLRSASSGAIQQTLSDTSHYSQNKLFWLGLF